MNISSAISRGCFATHVKLRLEVLFEVGSNFGVGLDMTRGNPYKLAYYFTPGSSHLFSAMELRVLTPFNWDLVSLVGDYG